METFDGPPHGPEDEEYDDSDLDLIEQARLAQLMDEAIGDDTAKDALADRLKEEGYYE